MSKWVCERAEEVKSMKALGSTMRRVIAIGCALVAITLALISESLSEGRGSLSMELSLQHPRKEEYLIHVKLKNHQPKSISVLNIDLPWLTPNDFVLVPEARRMDPQQSLLQQGGPPSDYMHMTYRLEPNQSLEGDVKLHSMFPTLLNDIERYGVIVQWRCKAKHLVLTCEQADGGEFVIPKGGLSELHPME